jgi:quercetin dioxygenase-like cupin family protein
MADRVAEHQMTELAALHALGALSQHEARAFDQHLAEGCTLCSAEFRSFEGTVNDLAFSVPEAEPPEDLRGRLLERLGELPSGRVGDPVAGTASDEFVSIQAAGGQWQEVQDGVLLKTLYVDQASGIATSLVRMTPGTALPGHHHLGVEQFFVIEGDCNVAGQRLGPGDYHRAAAGSTHDTTYTVDGTLFLLIAPEHYEVVEAR